jgi:hypothetical protein
LKGPRPDAEQLVDQALVAEHDQPAVGAHPLADEERQEQPDQQQLAQPGRAGPDHGIGVRKAEHQHDQGDDQRGERAMIQK